jgi:hypothetical protein
VLLISYQERAPIGGLVSLFNLFVPFALIRLHAQALTLAALAGSALVEYYDHRSGSGSRVHQYAKQFITPESNPQKE